jgi:hypothetical protein
MRTRPRIAARDGSGQTCCRKFASSTKPSGLQARRTIRRPGCLREPHSTFWPIYGRRRVGKSELILQFGKNHPTVYLVGKRAPADQMMREFLEEAAIFLEVPLLASMPVESWKKTIEAVVQRWEKKVGAHRAVTQIIPPELEAYFELCYESLCREALPLLYEKENVSALYEVGSYWDSQIQIDIVGLRRDGWIDLGECKWGAVKSLVSAAAELKEKVRHYPNAEDATVGRHLFVRSLKGGAGRNGPKTYAFIPWMSSMSRHLPPRSPRASRVR